MKNTTLCYIEKDEQYLMLHRIKKRASIDPNHDKWIGIGGKCEEDESPEECIIREAREETGLSLNNPILRGVVTFVSDKWDSEYMFVYTATDFSGEIIDDCNEGILEWVPKRKVTRLPIWEGDKLFLRLLMEESPFFQLKLTYEGEKLIGQKLTVQGKSQLITMENVLTDTLNSNTLEADSATRFATHQGDKIINWAVELQSLAQAGLFFNHGDMFDVERFQRIRDIAAEMVAEKTDADLSTVKEYFCNENGYQTPKLDSRAAIFKDGKVLLVQEASGRWSLPGGWVDVNVSVGDNTIKEAFEESGMNVRIVKLIAVQDRERHNKPEYVHKICKVFIQCEVISGEFQKNIETLDCRYFAMNELPPLAEEKNNTEQIEMCFRASQAPNWQAIIE